MYAHTHTNGTYTFPSSRVEMALVTFMCGRLEMAAKILTHVQLMATRPACTQLQWGQPHEMGHRHSMMRTAVGRWPQLSHTALNNHKL